MFYTGINSQNGVAMGGEDYIAVGESVPLPSTANGVRDVAIPITIIDDTIKETGEDFTLTVEFYIGDGTRVNCNPIASCQFIVNINDNGEHLKRIRQ